VYQCVGREKTFDAQADSSPFVPPVVPVRERLALAGLLLPAELPSSFLPSFPSSDDELSQSDTSITIVPVGFPVKHVSCHALESTPGERTLVFDFNLATDDSQCSVEIMLHGEELRHGENPC